MENIDHWQSTDKEDRALTRADVEALLLQVGSSEQLVLEARNLRGADLRHLHLAGANLSRANLSGADLSGADLSGAFLIGAGLWDAKFRKANLRGAHLRGADLSFSELYQADLGMADLDQAILEHTILWQAKLSGAKLTDANLSGANFNNADLSGADLRAADFSDANLSNADLSGADFNGAGLFGAILNNAKLREKDLAYVVGVNLGQIIETHQNILPEVVPAFSIRIRGEPLTPPTLLAVFTVVSEIATKCWLIAQERFADLIQYAQTHDVRFVEETKLQFTRITYNSPFDASFKIDLSASNVAEGIVTAIDGVTQAKQRLRKAELENAAKAQEIEVTKNKALQEDRAGLLELEQKELAVERERLDLLEKQLDLQKKAIEYALEVAARTVAVLRPDADEQVKTMLLQALLPTLLQANNVRGMELVLPPDPKDEIQQKEPPK
ncbi:MAG: pentapeptide repeat-containing protein [Acidobacteriota bacterium]|nr:pentapeptide repeat-containing protein [Acidobacteriota bacterium]